MSGSVEYVRKDFSEYHGVSHVQCTRVMEGGGGGFGQCRYLTWDEKAFPHPEAMQDSIASRGRKLVTIVDPHIKRDAAYPVFKTAEDKGYYVKTSDGKDYDGCALPAWPAEPAGLAVARRMMPFGLDRLHWSLDSQVYAPLLIVRRRSSAVCGILMSQSWDLRSAIRPALLRVCHLWCKRVTYAWEMYACETAENSRNTMKASMRCMGIPESGRVARRRWCWPGSSSYLDVVNPEVRDWWATNFLPGRYPGATKHLYVWNDMNEPSVFNGPEVNCCCMPETPPPPSPAPFPQRQSRLSGG